MHVCVAIIGLPEDYQNLHNVLPPTPNPLLSTRPIPPPQITPPKINAPSPRNKPKTLYFFVTNFPADTLNHLAAFGSSPYDTSRISWACEGNTAVLACPANHNIEVTKVSWGRETQELCTGDGLNTAATECRLTVAEKTSLTEEVRKERMVEGGLVVVVGGG